MAIDLEKIDVYEFLSELGINNIKDEGREVKYSCFGDSHYRGDANPSASMEKGTTKFYCFSCGMSGNAVTFLATLENVSPIQSSIWIKERFGGLEVPQQGKIADTIKDMLNKKVEQKINTPAPVLDEKEALKRRVSWKSEEAYFKYIGGEDWESSDVAPFIYMIKRGFSVDTLQDWDIGWDKISERITIPIRDVEGNLLGFKARSYNKDPKYLVLGGPEYGFEPYETSQVIFGADRFKLADSKHIIVCEGELNAIAMHQHGFKNVVGISGKFISDRQINIIKSLASSVGLIFDELDDSIRAAEKLRYSIPTSVVAAHDKDPADMTRDEVVSLLATSRSSLLEY